MCEGLSLRPPLFSFLCSAGQEWVCPFPLFLSGKNVSLKISFSLLKWYLFHPLPWGHHGRVKCALRETDTEAELRLQEFLGGVTLVKIKEGESTIGQGKPQITMQIWVILANPTRDSRTKIAHQRSGMLKRLARPSTYSVLSHWLGAAPGRAWPLL